MGVWGPVSPVAVLCRGFMRLLAPPATAWYGTSFIYNSRCALQQQVRAVREEEQGLVRRACRQPLCRVPRCCCDG